MKNFFLLMTTIIAPWAILFQNDDPVGGMIAMVMQGTIIGWIPASMWAWRVSHPASPKKPVTESKTNLAE